MKIMKAKIVWFPEKLSSIDFDSLENKMEWDQEHLNETYGMDIFYSEILQLYILPVYHFGTSWTHVTLNKLK